ncbi:MAG: hypothetical protein M9901_13385 [Lentimicrobium sp.]|nr:hypothetical protein [Lentimicrobium sp.]
MPPALRPHGKWNNPKHLCWAAILTAFYTDADGKRFPLVFKHVFDLDGPDFRYFSAIRKNLVELELDYETDIYVQEPWWLIISRMRLNKNKNWNNEALKSIAQRKRNLIMLILPAGYLFFNP